MTSTIKRILVCEDHPLVQMGIKNALKTILPNTLISIMDTGEKALQELKKYTFDLALFDLGLPDISGLELIIKAKSINSDIKIIVVTSCDQPSMLVQVKDLGVAGIMQKVSSLEHLSQALEWTQQGSNNIFLDPTVKNIIKESSGVNFTPRELEVLKEIVKGYSNQQIAESLNCSVFSIRFHRANILSKANVRSAAELTAWHLQGQRQSN